MNRQTISKYFQGAIELSDDVLMFKSNNFPEPGRMYKRPFLFESLTTNFVLPFIVSRPLNKEDLTAESHYLRKIQKWVKGIIDDTERRHEKEKVLLEKQLQDFMKHICQNMVLSEGKCLYI